MASRIRILNCYNACCVFNKGHKCELEEINLDYKGECEKLSYTPVETEQTFRTYRLRSE